MNSIQYLCLKCFLLAVCLRATMAWTNKPYGARRHPSSSQRPTKMYVPPSTTNTPLATESSPTTTAQHMLKVPGNPRTSNHHPRGKTSVKLSQSVLASCDTLPSFRTAHGILSPETVRRMEELVDEEYRSEALIQFLDRYRRQGPMSCLPMLSDPDVLPHLTNAMRNVLE
jgi:hypothetical protein